jgi:tetratricopeptide (TPR) repeat protein
MKELRRLLPEHAAFGSQHRRGRRPRRGARRRSRWRGESGQYLLEFEGDPANDSLKVVRHETRRPPPMTPRRGTAAEWRSRKPTPRPRSRLTSAPSPPTRRASTRINLGRLLHETGRLVKAEQAYRDALRTCGSDPVLLFNLGVLFEDMSHRYDALQAYEAALRINPELADCHYNLALIYERLRRPKEALRHMAQYRRLAK